MSRSIPAAIASVVLVAVVVARARAGDAAPRMLSVDHASIVSRGDLHYDKPAQRSEEGMPIGNGRTGTLVWTTPAALRMQINRVDVFGVDSTTHSFPRPHTEYASGCGYVDVQFDDDVLAGDQFKQDLSIYDGVMSVAGNGVSARVLAANDRDVIAIEIDDRRSQPRPINIDLRMLRYGQQYIRGTANDFARQHASVVQTNAHTATSKMDIRDGRVVLTQEFREAEFYDASAVVIGVIGRDAKASYYNESTVRLAAPAGGGKFTVLIASAASFDPKEDVAAAAVKQLDGVGDFEKLLASHQKWWHDFWSKSFVRLHSDDGDADYVAANYAYFLYVMASSSRGGNYPPRFGGMIWYTNGDMRAWGSQYWWANQSCYFNGLSPTNHFELMDPMFAMYSKMYDACATAAKQQWGSQGIWIPETTFFNGPDQLPDDIAAEMQDLYLLRKPWKDRSQKFIDYAQTVQSFNSRWNWISQNGKWELGRWIAEDKGAPPFGHVTHIFGTTAKIAKLYWQRYEYTQDVAWLRDRAYPMVKGAVEFYRNFPNLKKEADGKYHINHTNSNEPAWGVRDSDEDMSAMHGIVGPCIRASEILGFDASMRTTWQEFLQNLAPIPTSDLHDALKPENYDGPPIWVKGLHPAAKEAVGGPDSNTSPEFDFELCTLESTDERLRAIANATFDRAFRGNPIGPETHVATLSRLPISAAMLGRAEAVRYLLPSQLRAEDAARNNAPGVMRNRMSLREGPGATDCQRLGRVAEALHLALLQSSPARPGGEAVIRIAPALPKQWDADFTLLARGNFLVTASIDKGLVRGVEIESRSGGECRIRNPWLDKPLALYVNGQKSREVSDSILKIPTSKGDVLTLLPAGTKPVQKRAA
jgi:hypothetical protein